MLPLTAILEIIKLSLELSIRLYDDMPPAQRAAFAERHDKRMDFWQNLFNRFDKDEKEIKPNG